MITYKMKNKRNLKPRIEEIPTDHYLSGGKLRNLGFSYMRLNALVGPYLVMWISKRSRRKYYRRIA
jgi:hypothetical protein